VANVTTAEERRRAAFAFMTVLAGLLVAPSVAGIPPSVPSVAPGGAQAGMDVRFSVFRVADLQVTPVDFGSIMVNGQSGRVDMDGNGNLTYSGGVIQVSGFPQTGVLTLDGENVTANIMIDPRVEMGDGVAFLPSASAASVQLTGRPATVRIFGTILLPAGVPTHEYRGVLKINVTYN
jgi:hypothetical protein